MTRADIGTDTRHVVVLAPMPLEMDAITKAFGLVPANDGPGTWHGRVGRAEVTALHIGMGPPRARDATSALFDPTWFDPAAPDGRRPDHVMIAGICGGLSPDLEVGTLVNPEVVVEHSSGATYRHAPPGDAPLVGKLVTTEGVSLDHDLSRRLFAQGFVGVDMESSAVAEVCEAHGCPWSVYRCIGDRYFDGLLDERVVALSNPDGSADMDKIQALLAAEPGIAGNLERLARDSSLAARRAAEAAVKGCLALE